MRLLVTLSGLVIAICSIVALPRGDSQAAWPGGNGKVAFQSSGIWVMDADGSNRAQLTTIATDRQPSWSPDGTKIAFTRQAVEAGSASAEGGVVYEVWTMDANGVNQEMIGVGEHATWSPDGTRLLYALDGAIHEMDSDDGGNDEMITPGPFDGTPVYRPDGTKIAYSLGYDTGVGFAIDVMVADPDGNNEEIVFEGSSITPYPDWAPDGSAITFFANAGIYTSPYPGPDPELIVTKNGDEILRDPTYSPDGSTILFVRGVQAGSNSAGGIVPAGSFNYSVWSIGAGGQNEQPLPNDEPVAEFFPDWQPLSGPTATPTSSASPSPTPSPTPTPPGPTPSPSPTPVVQTELWGDHNCDGAIDGEDIERALLAIALPDEAASVVDCPDMEEVLQFVDLHPAGAGFIVWGDVYCSDAVNLLDVLDLLRQMAGTPRIEQPSFCPAVGDEVDFLN